eukprot:1560500-Pyramimonas_sp.AAC.1
MVQECMLDIFNTCDSKSAEPEAVAHFFSTFLDPIPANSPPASFEVSSDLLSALQRLKKVLAVRCYKGHPGWGNGRSRRG